MVNGSSKKLLVLDLDETLVHATKIALHNLDADFTFGDYFVYKRPKLDYFLTEAAKDFQLAVWSSAGDTYVEAIISAIKPQHVSFEITWGRTRCSQKWSDAYDTYYFEKRLDKLKKMGFKLEHILMVDDTAEKVACNYGNAIYVKEFDGDPLDNELPYLLSYLRILKDAENVRTIEKRRWRSEVV